MRLRKKAPTTAPAVPLCECGKYQVLVRVDGRGLCFGCHEDWLRAKGLGSAMVPDAIGERLAGWRPR